MKPGGQMHLYEPGTLMHLALAAQASPPMHSFTSTQPCAESIR